MTVKAYLKCNHIFYQYRFYLAFHTMSPHFKIILVWDSLILLKQIHKSVGFGVGNDRQFENSINNSRRRYMIKTKTFSLLLTLLPLLLLSGCTRVGAKSASTIIIYVATTTLAFLLLVGYCFFIKKKEGWFYVLFASVFVVNVGYLALATADTLEIALWANRISYLGSVFLPLSMFMTILKLSNLNYKKRLPIVLTLISVITFFITATPGYLDIYYRSATLEIIDGVSVLVKDYGPLHVLYLFYLIGYFTLMTWVTLHASIKKKLESASHMIIILIAVFVNICVWLLEQLVRLDFEFLSVSYIISELFLIGAYLMIQNQEALIASLKAQTVSPLKQVEEVMRDSEEFAAHCAFIREQLPKLTPTEREIYDCYVDGLSTKDVLSKLSIKENTLKFHNKNLYSKLGVSSRKQLIEYAKAILSSDGKA